MDRGLISIVDGRVVIAPACDGEEGSVNNGCPTIWMSKHQIAELFGCFVAKVVSNIAVVRKGGVLDKGRVYRFHHYKNGGGVELYNLEMITALAFRIGTRNADIFRRWLMERAVQPSRRHHQHVQVVIPVREKTLPN